MDGFNLFNIGFGEFFFILLLAGLVMGPHRIRQVALYLGKLTARLQRISREFRRQLTAELDAAERQELRDTVEDLKALRQEVADLRREIISGPQAAISESRAAFNEISKPLAGAAAVEAADEIIEENMIGAPSGEPSTNGNGVAENNQPTEVAQAPLPDINPVDIPNLVSIKDDPE